MLRILFPVCVLCDLRIEFFCPGHYSLSFLSWILFLPSLIFWTFWWLEFPSGAASLNPNERSLSKTGRFTSARDIPLFLTVYIQKLQVYFSSRYSCFFVHVDVILSLLKKPGEVIPEVRFTSGGKNPLLTFSPRGAKARTMFFVRDFSSVVIQWMHVIMHNA